MRPATLLLGILPLAYVSANPYIFRRQEASPAPPVGVGIPSGTPTDTPETTPAISPPPAEEETTLPTIETPTPSPPDPNPSSSDPDPIPNPTPGPILEPPEDPAPDPVDPVDTVQDPEPENDCPPCEDEPLFTSESASGKACYCLGGGERGKNNGDKEPWGWGPPACEYGSDGAGLPPSADGKPQVCSGNGAIPASRECLNSCNFMTTIVNSASPCNENVVNAANACARCSGANLFVQTGNDATGTYMNGEAVARKLIDGLQDWCAKPDRCYDLRGARTISGQNGCPVLAVDGRDTPADPGTGVPPQPGPNIAPSSTRSFLDLEGRPTFAVELLTLENPNFTANTEFAGSGRTTTAGAVGATGSARTSSAAGTGGTPGAAGTAGARAAAGTAATGGDGNAAATKALSLCSCFASVLVILSNLA